jgi:hypothetical protein
MKALIALLLAASVTVNVWLIVRRTFHPIIGRAAKTSVHSAEPARPTNSPPLNAAEAELLSSLDSADVTVLRDQLRAAGFDEATVRAAVEGGLRQHYREKLIAQRIEHLRTSWWRGNAARGSPTPSQRTLVQAPLRALLGIDPFDLADLESHYDFLPPEKRALLATIDLDYSELQTSRSGTNAQLKADVAAQEVLSREQRQDVLAALTPEERAEYDLRFSSTASQNARRFAAMDENEAEFRAIEPIIEAYSAKGKDVPQGPNSLAANSALQQDAIDQLVATVGYDRACAYLWATDSGPYRSTLHVLQEAGLPADNAFRLLQLASDTGAQAIAIHYDPQQTPEQKIAALAELQQATRPQLDALIPPESQAKLDSAAITWFTLLGEGSYLPVKASLMGEGWNLYPATSVAAPPKGNAPIIPRAQRTAVRH